jgi:hypothetical protein
MWTGRKMRKAAPSPGLETTLIQPSDCLTMPKTVASPSPVPSPTALVVKNGSKILPMTSGAMPGPSSLTSIRARSPGPAPV